jgi:type III secretion protein J
VTVAREAERNIQGSSRRGVGRSHALLFGWLASACAVPVATSLDESDANRVVAALERNGVAADKKPDPDEEGRFGIEVGRGDASFAIAVMTREELPPRRSPGLLDAIGKGSLVPGRGDEQAKLTAGIAGELQRTLIGLDGVIDARVHLALPRRDPLEATASQPTPTAAVLLKYRSATPPLSADEISRLVSGAVPGLDPARVTVVSKAVEMDMNRTGTELVLLGPLTTTRSSLPYLRWMIGGVALLNACMVALLIALWLRMRRVTAKLPPAE